MNGVGHRLTSLAFGGLIVTMLGTGHLVTPYPDEDTMLISIAWLAGILIGASAPDWMEIAIHRKDRRYSLIPHRTLTHWPPIWIAFAWYVWELNLPWYVESIAFGFIASSLLHIATDALSKSGVPILLPFASFRMRIPLYSTGRLSESVALIAIIALFSAASFAITSM